MKCFVYTGYRSAGKEKKTSNFGSEYAPFSIQGGAIYRDFPDREKK